MKKLLIIAVLTMFFGGTAWGAVYEWIGVDSIWNNSNNWQGAQPGASNLLQNDTLTILGGVSPALTDDINVQNLTITSGTLNIGGHNLTVTGTLSIAATGTLILSNGNMNVVTLNNSGIIELTGTQIITYTPPATGRVGGTIRYTGGTSVIPAAWLFGYSYTNLYIADTAIMSNINTNLSVQGTAYIGSNITSTGTQTYTGTVTLGAANITLKGTSLNLGVVTGTANNLTLDATTTIAITGAVGTTTAHLGDIKVLGTASATFSANVYSDDFSFTGNTLTVAAMDVTGSFSLNNSGNYTQNGAVAVHGIGGFVQAATATGNCRLLNNLTTTAAPITITRNFQVRSTTNVTLATNGGAVSLNTVTRRNQTTVPGNLTINAGTGNVTIGSTMGTTTTRLGNISIQGNAVSLNGAVYSSGTVNINNSNSITTNIINSTINSTVNGISLTAANGITTGGAITASTGTVSLTTTGNIAVNAAIQARTVSLTANASGNINVNAAIVAQTTAATLTATNGNITVSNTGSIEAQTTASLTTTNGGNITVNTGSIKAQTAVSLNAGSTGNVELKGDVTSNGTGNNVHTSGTAAVYISANKFSGDGNILLSNTTNTNGQVCVHVYGALLYAPTTLPARIHYHVPDNKHIVYRVGSDTGSYPIEGGTITAADYLYIQAENNLGSSINFEASGTGNIYIIDIGDAAPMNVRTAVFSTGSGGYIEIRGIYTSSNPLTLNTGIVQLANGETSSSNHAAVSVPSFTPGGTPSLKLRGGNASITATAGNISLASVTGTTPNANHLKLDASNTISITGAVGTQTTPLGDINIVRAAPATFSAIVYAKSYTQGDGSASFNGTQTYSSNFSFTGNTLTVATMVVTGSILINSGNVTANGPVGASSYTQIAGNAIFNGAQTYSGNFSFTGGGTLTTNTANATITAHGGFTATGDCFLSSNIETTSTDITFNNNLQIRGNIQLKSNNGNIILTRVTRDTTANRTLTINAGTGNVTVSDYMGSNGTRLGNIEIHGNAVSLNGAVYSTGKTTINNSGTFTAVTPIVSNGGFVQSGGQCNLGVSGTGANITTSNNVISFTGPITLNNNIEFNTNTGAGDVIFSGTSTINGAYNMNITAGTGNITFDGVVGGANPLGDITLTCAGTVNINAAITINSSHDLIFNGTNETIKVNANVAARMVIFRGTGGKTLSQGNLSSTYLKDITVNYGTKLTLASGIRQNGNLIVGSGTSSGDAAIDIGNHFWYMGGTPSGNGFIGTSGTLTLTNEKAQIITSRLNLNGPGFTVAGSGRFIVTGSDPSNPVVVINSDSNVTLPAEIVIEMKANGNGNQIQILETNQLMCSLHVTNGVTNLIYPLLSGIFEFIGSVKITNNNSDKMGILDARNLNIIMYPGLTGTRNSNNHTLSGSNSINYTRWEIDYDIAGTQFEPEPNVAFRPSLNMNVYPFRQDAGRKVSFQKAHAVDSNWPVFFEIAGNTLWRTLECIENGAVMQFSMDPCQHTVLEQFITRDINSNSAGSPSYDPDNYVTLTRLTENHPNLSVDRSDFRYIYNYSTAGAPSDYNTTGIPGTPNNGITRNLFWNINFMPRTPFGVDPLKYFNNVILLFSRSYSIEMPIEPDTENIYALPFYQENLDPSDNYPYKYSDRVGYFNYGWVVLRKILYSFTEDGDGDGRLDRLRIQTNIALNGDFSDFELAVEGYEIDTKRTGSVNGYALVNQTYDTDSFYVYLVPHPVVDTGSTPRWSVIRNTSLMDESRGISLVGQPETDFNITPTDTIPPRIAYTLTLPGYQQTYVRMSEPVVLSSRVNATPSNLFSGLPYSEIERTPESQITWVYYTNEEGYYTNNIPEGNLGYLLTLGSSLDIFNLTSLPTIDNNGSPGNGYFTVQDIVDQALMALDWSDPAATGFYSNYYKPPKYPINWNYSEYVWVRGNFHVKDPNFLKHLDHLPSGSGYLATDAWNNNQPEPYYIARGQPGSSATFFIPPDGSLSDVFLPSNRLLTPAMMTMLSNGVNVSPSNYETHIGNNPGGNDRVTRRITDILVSIAPSGPYLNNYFVWPVWARYTELSNPNQMSLGGDFWGGRETDIGLIWEFDGTKYLEARSIEFQARSLLDSSWEIDMILSTDIQQEYRNPPLAGQRGRNSGGMWLPESSDSLYRLIYFSQYAPNYRTAVRGSSTHPLYTFILNQDIISGTKLDFVFRIHNNDTSVSRDYDYLYAARLDAPRGSAPPPDWYRLVRPFSFDLQNVRLQRGGVTILNNVINSNVREQTFIRYHLVRPGRVTIQVFTLDGTLVKSIRRNEQRTAGEWTDAWDGTNTNNMPVARGMYFIRVVGPDIDEIRKVMVVKE